jgi:mono/diheme cytochrome c family protein
MLKTSFSLALAALPFLTASLAANVDTSKLPPPADKKDVTFAKDILPIFEKSCVNCHGAERPKARYRTDTRENTLKPGASKEEPVIVGQSAKSPLVHYIADLVDEMEMPPLDKRDRNPNLTKEQIALVRAWIDQGAK